MGDAGNTATGEGHVLSKNAQKRLLKRKKHMETRQEWKAKMREKKRLKKVSSELQGNSTTAASARQAEPKGQVLIDLAYDSLMTEKEISSLASQVCRCYSINRRGCQPFNLAVAGLGDDCRLRAELSRAYPEYKRWTVNFAQDPLEELLAPEVKDKTVYLSADSDVVLDCLDENTTYVIGGLIDRNRHKNVAFERANTLGLPTARLPLLDHIKLKSSQVLSIVHVFEILCRSRECGDWGEAIRVAIPERKRFEVNK